MAPTARAPTARPLIIRGPSKPTGREALELKVTEMTLAASVPTSVAFGYTMPFNCAFASAMPLPAATGWSAQGRWASVARRREMPRCTPKPATDPEFCSALIAATTLAHSMADDARVTHKPMMAMPTPVPAIAMVETKAR